MKRKLLILLALTFIQPAIAMLPGDEFSFVRRVSPQKDLNHRFWNLINEGHKKGSLEKIEKIVAEGCDINSMRYGDTALTHAAHHGPARVYELLITLKADVNRPNMLGDTPFLVAFKVSHFKLCELLIASGANVDAKNNRDESLVLYTASYGHLELTKLLIAHRADVNTKCKQGQTPLLLAARNGNLEICRLLLMCGASPIARNDAGHTPLIYAAQNNHDEICALLVNWPKVMKTSMVTLLYCIKTLGKQNAQLKFLYKEREQLLRPALKKNIITRQELLNAQDNSGKTAYFFGQIPLLRPIESERK